MNTGTDIYGIFGYPVAHTFSPRMHQAAYKALGMKAFYVPFLVAPQQLKRAVLSLSSLSIRGVNVTIPHKRAVVPYMDRLAGDAAWMRAVNVIQVKDNKLIGHNTDGAGFIMSLRRDAWFNPKGKKVVLLGAGGAAGAVAGALIREGIRELVLVNRTRSKAEKLKRALAVTGTKATIVAARETGKALLPLFQRSDLIVNGTSVGMKAQDTRLVPPEAFKKGQTVMDLIYIHETTLMRDARRRGAQVIGGLGMLLYQGALAFEIWTGRRAPLAAMRRELTSQIKERRQH